MDWTGGDGYMNKQSICKWCSNSFIYCDKSSYGIYCSNKCKGFNQRLTEDKKIEKIKTDYNKFVIKQRECWNWKGPISTPGYGQIRFGSIKPNRIDAHRASWIIHKGEIPKNIFVCHTCDNRICTNPDHLFLGTLKDNIRDMNNKKRNKGNFAKGIIPFNKKISKEQEIEVKSLLNKNTLKEIALKFDVTIPTIWKIKQKLKNNHE